MRSILYHLLPSLAMLYCVLPVRGEDTVVPDFIAVECANSGNLGKKVQVFGGSISVKAESEVAKDAWRKYLGMEIQSCGRGGAGFALDKSREKVNMASDNGLTFHTDYNCIQNQVKWYASAEYDIYILWCSTNDYTMSLPLGAPSDYTEADGFDEDKRTTQCGGINWCIRKLREINPNAKIYLFDSLKFFKTPSGYTKTEGKACLFDYVEAQRECAEKQGIAYLRQYDFAVNTLSNSRVFYKEDLYHLSELGYARIAPLQLHFLATENDIETTGYEANMELTVDNESKGVIYDAMYKRMMITVKNEGSHSLYIKCMDVEDDIYIAVDYEEMRSNGASFQTGNESEMFVVMGNREHQRLRTFALPLSFTTLPVVCLDFDTELPYSRTQMTPGRITLLDPWERTNGMLAFTSPIQAHYRGQTAMLFEKKGYLIAFEDENGGSRNVDVFGIRNDDKWILDAMVVDPSRMRNQICFDLWNEMSVLRDEKMLRNGVRAEYVEVMLNGKYHGLYRMSDKVNRKLLGLEKAKSATDIRGVLYKCARADNESHFLKKPSEYKAMESVSWYDWDLKYPDEYPSETTWAPLEHLLQENSSQDVDYITQHWTASFSRENALEYVLFVMLVGARDNAMHNVYLSYADIRKDGHAWLTPWDLDGTFGRNGYAYKYDLFSDPFTYMQQVEPFKTLYDNRRDEFTVAIMDVLKKKGSILSPSHVNDKLDGYAQQLGSSGAWKREYERWKGKNVVIHRERQIPGTEMDESIEDELMYMKEFYEKNYDILNKLLTDIVAPQVPVSPDNIIYRMDGVAFRQGDYVGLPKGIYISKGKKIYVR